MAHFNKNGGDSRNPGDKAWLYVGRRALHLVNAEKLNKSSTELTECREMLNEIGAELRVISVNGWDEESSEYIRGLLANKILRLEYLVKRVRTKVGGVKDIFSLVRDTEPEVFLNTHRLEETDQYLTQCEEDVSKLVDRLPGLLWIQIEPPLYE